MVAKALDQGGDLVEVSASGGSIGPPSGSPLMPAKPDSCLGEGLAAAALGGQDFAPCTRPGG